MIVYAAILLILLTFYSYTYCKEGMEEDYLALAMKSIESAMKDERMTKEKKIALEDALSYAKFIKNI